MRAHTKKHGQAAWTYTHHWRAIAATNWQGAAAWASTDQPQEVPLAKRQGYQGIALVVPSHPSRQVYEYHGLRVLPCPAQFHQADGSRQTTCERCGICAHPERLERHADVLGFAQTED
jgi:hypothetical protein